jgi:photosystem II stability/assembly factor-like uncharacterized protein
VNNAPSGVPALYKSMNGGATWNQLAVSVGQDCMSDVLINPNDSNEVYAVGCYGTFLKSTNDGTNWTTLSLTRTFGTGNFPYDYLGLGVPRLGYDSQADRLYIAYGPFGLLVSQDRGATWIRRTADDVPGMALYSLFYQPTTGALYLGGSNGLWQGQRNLFLPVIKKDAS